VLNRKTVDSLEIDDCGKGEYEFLVPDNLRRIEFELHCKSVCKLNDRISHYFAQQVMLNWRLLQENNQCRQTIRSLSTLKTRPKKQTIIICQQNNLDMNCWYGVDEFFKLDVSTQTENCV
jgi:hypothetical protein